MLTRHETLPGGIKVERYWWMTTKLLIAAMLLSAVVLLAIWTSRNDLAASDVTATAASAAKPESVCTTVRRAEPQGETRNTGLPEPKRSAAKLSEQLSHRRSIYRRSGTGCAANRSLRAVHRWQRRCAKRPDNVPPRTRGPATARKPVESASYNSGQGARLAGKVNASEWLLNVVTRTKRK